MLWRFGQIAPAVVAALALAGCSFFAPDPPPLDLASDEAARS
jgi:hypothetical protein